MGKESYRDVKPTEQGPNVISRSRGSGARRKRRAETQTLQEIPSDLVEGGFRRTASDSTPLDGMPLARSTQTDVVGETVEPLKKGDRR